MYQINVETLLKSGAHFGHPTSKWNPNFKKYIVAQKNGIVASIDLPFESGLCGYTVKNEHLYKLFAHQQNH